MLAPTTLRKVLSKDYLVTSYQYQYVSVFKLLSFKGEDPQKLLFHVFFFPALIILIVSNTAMCIKVKLMLRNLNNTQKAENVFIGMLGVFFLFWLLYTAPFILVDTWLDSCFQKTGLHAAAYILNWAKVNCSPSILWSRIIFASLSVSSKLITVQKSPLKIFMN